MPIPKIDETIKKAINENTNELKTVDTAEIKLLQGLLCAADEAN